MDTSKISMRQAHRLIQFGMFLFLLALLIGLTIPLFKIPRLGLSAHLLGILQGIFLIVVGLLWHKFTLNIATSRVLFWLVLYGCFSAWGANVIAGVWGFGNTMLPIAAGQAHGNAFQEGLIMIMLRSAAVSLLATVILILWGLRFVDNRR